MIINLKIVGDDMKQIKNSRQRDMILQALKLSCTHPTADELYQTIKLQDAHISLATIYRNLNLMDELGIIRKIPMGSAPDRYDPNAKKHAHISCRNCGKVCDLELSSIDAVEKELMTLTDFCAITYDVVFTGLCAQCQKNQKKES